MGNVIDIYVPQYAGVYDTSRYDFEQHTFEYGHSTENPRVFVHAPNSIPEDTMMRLADLVTYGLNGWELKRWERYPGTKTILAPERIGAGNKPNLVMMIINTLFGDTHPKFEGVEVNGQTLSFEVRTC